MCTASVVSGDKDRIRSIDWKVLAKVILHISQFRSRAVMGRFTKHCSTLDRLHHRLEEIPHSNIEVLRKCSDVHMSTCARTYL